jgi:hypothetical protein
MLVSAGLPVCDVADSEWNGNKGWALCMTWSDMSRCARHEVPVLSADAGHL